MTTRPDTAPEQATIPTTMTKRDKRRPFRILLIVGGAALLLIAGAVTFVALLANDIITFTKKTQSFELAGGRVLEIHRTSAWEHEECKFAVRNGTNGKLLIARTRFEITTHEHRTTFEALSGSNSGVVGLVGSDPEIVLVLLNARSLECVAANPLGLTETEKDRGEKLLLALKSDYPDRDLALSGTRGAAMLMRKHDIERFRQTFARMDAAIKLGTTFSNALAVSWKPTAIATNGDGIIEAQFQAEPSFTWLGPINDRVLTNGFVLVVSNGTVIGKTYLVTTSY